MAKIELSLESHINLIIAKGLIGGYKVPREDIDALVQRIHKNFYSPHGEAVAAEARFLWKTIHNRDITHRLFTVAYNIEHDWREKNGLRTFVNIVTSTQAYEAVPFQKICSCPKPTMIEIREIFKTMHRTDYEKTRYWDTIKTVTLQHFGFECQATIGTIPCGCQNDLYVIPRTDVIEPGTEHDNYKHTLTVLCERHKLLYFDKNNIEPLLGGVVGQSGATYGD